MNVPIDEALSLRAVLRKLLHKKEEASRAVPFDLWNLLLEEAPSDTEPESKEGKWLFLAVQHTRAGDSQPCVLCLPREVTALSTFSLLVSQTQVM